MVLGRSVRSSGGCGLRQRSVRGRKNPLGAILDDDELHDDLQLASCDVPNHMFPAPGAIGWLDDDRTGSGPRRQSDGEHVVRDELHDDAGHVPDDLRQNIAVAVIGPASNCRD